MMCVWQCSPSSTMIQRRPILWATAPVVPEPAKESRTKSPGLVAISRIRSKQLLRLRRVETHCRLAEQVARDLLLRFLVVARLRVAGQSVVGAEVPVLASDRNVLTPRNVVAVPAPNQIVVRLASS